MSRMGLITRACQCLTCLWLMYDPSADCHVCMGLGLRSCDCNTQHDTVCSLWQQLRHVGDLWVLWVTQSSCLVLHPYCEPRWIRARSSQVQSSTKDAKTSQTFHVAQMNQTLSDKNLSHLHLWGSRPWTSLELEWEMNVSVCTSFIKSMIFDALWNSMVFQHASKFSKATQQDHGKKKASDHNCCMAWPNVSFASAIFLSPWLSQLAQCRWVCGCKWLQVG